MSDTYNLGQIRAIIGLGNPGARFIRTRHNIGFRVVEELADRYSSSWSTSNDLEYADISVTLPSDNDDPFGGDMHRLHLVKPQTFMNNSGCAMAYLKKKGIGPEQCLVIHDELEKPFGKISVRFGGSARGHNGLRSLIQAAGPEFWRLRFGIGRPADKADVGDYVLRPFSAEEESEVAGLIATSCDMLVT